MLRVGLRLLVFCLPILLVWAVLELWPANVPNSCSAKRQRLEALAKEVDTLILGSSRAYYGIAPKQLTGCAFNLANVSQSLYYDDRLMTLVLPELPKLSRVIIEIQDTSLFFQLQESKEDWRQYYYQQEWHIPPPELKDRLDIRMWSRFALPTGELYRSSLRKALFAVVRGRGKEFVPDVTPDTEMDDRGWRSPTDKEPSPQNLSAASLAITLARHRSVMKAINEPVNLAYLSHLLSVLRERNIEVVFITMPVWGAYSEKMDAEYWDRAQADLEQLTKKYGARYLSFLSMPQLDPEDYWDVDHLSPRGAIRFTEWLNSKLESRAADVRSVGGGPVLSRSEGRGL